MNEGVLPTDEIAWRNDMRARSISEAHGVHLHRQDAILRCLINWSIPEADIDTFNRHVELLYASNLDHAESAYRD